MKTIGHSAAASPQLPRMVPPREISAGETTQASELRERFTQFVGEAFFGQMIKAMRSTVSKAAYFHGGRAEEVFQGQLDQQLAQHLTEASAARFAEPMFERQFPHLADPKSPSDLGQLTQLRRA